jgi:hypothetical protein
MTDDPDIRQKIRSLVCGYGVGSETNLKWFAPWQSAMNALREGAGLLITAKAIKAERGECSEYRSLKARGWELTADALATLKSMENHNEHR